MSELLPCPFCGGEAKSNETSIPPPVYWVQCEECGIETEASNYEDRPIAAWNRRVSEKVESENGN